MTIVIYYIGRPKDPHVNAIAEDFLKRASRYSPARMVEIKPERVDLVQKHPSAQRIYLDPAGRSLDSQGFASLVGRAELAAQDLVFLVGGHEGIPAAWRPEAHLLLSLSPLTFPHELARAMLAEQIYRAWAILRGHPYPR